MKKLPHTLQITGENLMRWYYNNNNPKVIGVTCEQYIAYRNWLMPQERIIKIEDGGIVGLTYKVGIIVPYAT